MARCGLPRPSRQCNISGLGRLYGGARQFGPRCRARILALALLARGGRAAVCICPDSVSRVSGDTSSWRLEMRKVSPNNALERTGLSLWVVPWSFGFAQVRTPVAQLDRSAASGRQGQTSEVSWPREIFDRE